MFTCAHHAYVELRKSGIVGECIGEAHAVTNAVAHTLEGRAQCPDVGEPDQDSERAIKLQAGLEQRRKLLCRHGEPFERDAAAEAKTLRKERRKAAFAALGGIERIEPARAQLSHHLVARRRFEHAAHHGPRTGHGPVLELRHARSPAPRAAPHQW